MTDINIWRKQYVRDEFMLATSMTRDSGMAYLLLLMRYRLHGGPLPDDDAKLSRLISYSIDEWLQCRDEVKVYFNVRGGKWIHTEEDAHIFAARERSVQNKESGKKGGQRSAEARKRTL